MASVPFPALPAAASAGAPAVWAALAVDPRGEGLAPSEAEDFERRMGAAWPGVVRLVDRLLAWPGAGSEVEDVAQEVFLAAWKQRASFRGEAQWTTWLHAIAVRRARNAARSRSRRERWFGLLGRVEDIEAGFAPEDSPADTDAAHLLRAALGRMRHADREVLVLRYLEEVPVEEAAARLGVKRAAMDTRLSRARARLRELLPEGAELEVLG